MTKRLCQYAFLVDEAGDSHQASENSPRSSLEPGQLSRGPIKPSTEYNGYWLTSELCATLVSLIVGLAWPATALLLLYLLAEHVTGIKNSVNDFLQNKQSVEASIGPTVGVAIKIVQGEVQSGLSPQVAQQVQEGSVPIERVAQAAASAAKQIVPGTTSRPETLVKVLWVDDHPENNIGLQYAFQALGIVVICVDSNDGIGDAFATAKRFDVAITDMYRDAVRDKPSQPEGGLETVSIISKQHPEVPVIIYASGYAAAHANERPSPSVLAVTNDGERVFTLVTEIAAKKLK